MERVWLVPLRRGERAMRSRLLVVGRDVGRRARLARMLKAAGYAIEIAEDSGHLQRIDLKGIALAIVDPLSQGAEVTELIGSLETATGRGVLVLGSGTTAGAVGSIDPSDEAAVIARISSLLAPATTAAAPTPLLRFANYSLDAAGQSLIDHAGVEIALTHKEYRLLEEFVQHPGRVLSRDHLLQVLSGRDADMYDRSVDMLVVRLRRRIEPDSKKPSLILTVPGRGYKLTAAVQTIEVAAGTTVSPASTRRGPAERRQVTALSAESVPGNGGKLPDDPEKLLPLIEAHRRRATAVVSRYNGIVAHCVAREILAYFGHPVAHEDAVANAIHAGLALTECPTDTDAGIPSHLTCRIGIATSIVVADPGGEVIGDAPSMAAEMRRMAEPGQVIIAPSTQRLGGKLFVYDDSASTLLKGASDERTAFRVLGASTSVSRSEALYQGGMTPLVGREPELELLLTAWRQAEAGEGRVVLLSGDPGIGKSRLLVELDNRLAAQTHTTLRHFCSPLHQGSALRPIIARWKQEAGFTSGDTIEERRRKLEAVVAGQELSPAEIALIADMIGIPTAEESRRLDLSPKQRKHQTFDVLQKTLARLAQRQPVLMQLEDVQWIDSSSHELLDTMIRQITGHRILLVVSFRPTFNPPWIGHAGVSVITLTRLGRRQSISLAEHLTGVQALTRPVLERIIDKADGIPLFVEELTKAILATAPGSQLASAVPTSLQASLLARLDQLPAAKQLAQIAAVIGREFPQSLLIEATGLSAPQVAEAIEQLIAAELLFYRGTPPDVTYTFKHALLQEIAYESLLIPQRQHYHGRIAQTILEKLPEWADEQPEVVAHHFTKADLPAAALEWWSKAGDLALRRFAYAEATAHFETALRLVDELEETPRNRSLRLKLQIAYANALRIARGFGMPETQAAFTVARNIAASIQDVSERFPAYYGLWSASFLRGDLVSMQEMVATFARDVQIFPNSPELAIAYRICGMTHWFEGHFREARRYLGRALAIRGGSRDREILYRFGQDVASPAMTYQSIVLWCLGYFDHADSLADEAISCALATQHVPTIAYAHAHAAIFAIIQRDCRRVMPHAQALLALAQKHGMPLWLAFSTFLEGWARCCPVAVASATAEIREGLNLMRSQHQKLFIPLLATLLAEMEAEAGRPEVGLADVNAELTTVAEIGQCWHLSELHRARGKLLLKCSLCDVAAAERSLLEAIDIARSQAARLFELQATVELACLWVRESKRSQARRLILPICEWFDVHNVRETPGALREARTTLRSLVCS
jgi:DNA-binding response OmpR family regulator/class 3 adenylate cyclase/predicted ATPase